MNSFTWVDLGLKYPMIYIGKPSCWGEKSSSYLSLVKKIHLVHPCWEIIPRIFTKINQSKIVVYIFTSICEDTRISCGYLIFKSLAISLKQDDSKSSLSDENPLDSYQPVRPVERKLDTSWKLGVCSLKVSDSLNLLIRSQKSEGIVLWTSVLQK